MGEAARHAPQGGAGGPPPPIPPAVEQRLREVAYEHAGIVLGPDKATLLATRVSKRMRSLRISDYRQYIAYFDQHDEELQEFLNVITTNTTSFWRESRHFTVLADHFTERIRAGTTRFRIWCAASSTGQEPYTIALVLAPLVRAHHLDLRILATDIDTNVLGTARAATYDGELVRQVPPEVRQWGFERLEDGQFRVVQHVRQLVQFGQLNLSRPPFPMKGPLDVIFCRNVMIYLDHPTRTGLAREFERLLAPGGLAIVGHSETLSGHTRTLRPLIASVYRKPTDAP